VRQEPQSQPKEGQPAPQGAAPLPSGAGGGYQPRGAPEQKPHRADGAPYQAREGVEAPPKQGQLPPGGWQVRGKAVCEGSGVKKTAAHFFPGPQALEAQADCGLSACVAGRAADQGSGLVIRDGGGNVGAPHRQRK